MSRSLPNRTFFSISQVSIAIGVSADTLRRLEAKGKIKPKRGSGKRRLYSLDDVALLRQILKKPDQKKSFTIRQAADILTISVDTLRRWEKKGKIKSMRTPGGHRRFSFEAIEKVKETKYKPISKPESPVIKKTIQPELKPVDIPQLKPILTTSQPEYKQVYFNLSLIAFVIVSAFMISIVRLSTMVIGQADELAMQTEVQIVDLEGQVLGVETEGGSIVTLAKVLDSDFNLSVNGYVEGNVLKSTSTSDAPLLVANDTKVENLNADLLDGKDWADLPALITAATPDMYDFTEFKDSMALDASTDIALGSLTLSTSGAGALDFNSTGQVSFAGNVDAENGLDVTGNLTASGDLTVTGGDITLGGTSIFSGGDTASLNNIDSIDSTTEGTFESALDFLRSDTSDSYTSGTLSFSDGTFLDLSAIIHNDSALQGLRLPQNTSFTSLTSGEGFVAWDTDDNKLQVFDGSSWADVGGSAAFSAITSGTNTSAAMVVGTGASLTYSGTGTITASDLTCVDCLDFIEFANSMTLDETTDIALGSLTLSTSGTGALDYNSTGLVSFAGNLDAESGLDVTNASLTVGGSYSWTTGGVITAATNETINGIDISAGAVSDVASLALVTASNTWDSSGNLTTSGNLDVDGSTNDIAGTLNLSGSNLTTTGALAFTPGGALTVGATGQNLTLQGAITAITSTGANNDITLTAADDIIFTDAQVTSIQLSDVDTTLPNSNTGIVDAINDAYTAATASGPWTRDAGSGTIYPTTLGDKVGIGTTTPANIISKLFVTGNTTLTGKSLAIFDQTETEDILTASASGTTKFVINNSGYIGVLTDNPGGVINIEGNGLASSENLLQLGTSAGNNWGGTGIDFNYLINDGIGIDFSTIAGSSGVGIDFYDIRSGSKGIFIDNIASGGIGIHADLSVHTGTAIKVTNTDFGYINAYGNNILDISSARNVTIDPYVDTANFLNITRADTTSGASADLTYADLVEFSSTCTQTSGTCTDASNILVLEQNYASATGSVLEITNSGSGAEIDFLSTSPTINTANTGTLAFSDGTNTLAAIKDQGVYPFWNIAGKTDTGDPASCAEGDIYYNAFDDTISVCHSGNTWEALDGGGSGTSWWGEALGVLSPVNSTLDLAVGGTATASAKFYVSASTGDLTLANSETISNATNTEIALSDGTNTLTMDFNEDTATAIDFTTNASIDLTFNPGGNVGIGTTSPSQLLTVAKDDASTDTQLILGSYTRTTSGTAADNIGLFVQGDIENDGGTTTPAAEWGAILRDANSATGIGGEFVVKTWRDSAAQEGLWEALSVYVDSSKKWICGNSVRENGPDCFGFTIGSANQAVFAFDGINRWQWDYTGSLFSNQATDGSDMQFTTLGSANTIAFDQGNDGTDLFIENGGNVGIGIVDPENILHLYLNDASDIAVADGSTLILEQDSTGDAGIQFELTSGQVFSLGIDNSSTNDDFILFDGSSARLTIDGSSGNVTIASDLAVNGGDITSTSTTLNIDVGNTGTINFRDGTNTLVVISDQGTTGRLAVSDSLQVGSTSTVAYSRFGTGTTDHSLDASNDLVISDDLEVDGVIYLDGGAIHNSAGTATISFTATPLTTTNTLSASSWLVENTASGNVGLAALLVNQARDGDLFTASNSGVTKFRIANDGSVTIDGVDTMLTVGSGSGKIDVGTVDPVYNIGGEKYATYMAGMIGVKEEITDTITTNQYVPGIGYRHVIDFTNLDRSSDLWLFGKATDIGKHIDDLVVLLSPSGNTRSWYEIDKENYTISIYSSEPTTISYRLTAPRFDAEEWSNYNTNPESFGFLVDDDELIGTGEFNQEMPSLSDYEIFKQNTGYQIQTISDEIIEGVGAFAGLAVANIKAGVIETKELIVENGVSVAGTIKAGAVETGELTTDSFLAFQGTIDNLLITGGLVSPSIKTQEISPIEDSNLVINLENSAPEAAESSFGRLIIKGEDSQEIASIDAEGNATFSGTLQSEEVKTKEIIADKIYANEIVSRTGYFDNINTATSSAITREEIEELLKQAQEDQSLLANMSDWSVNTISDSSDLNELTVKNIFITQQAATHSLSVAESITIGSDLIIQGASEGSLASSIDTLTKPLQIQSLGLAPIEIMAGKVKINTEGDIEITGNLYVAGIIESSGLTLKETDQSETENGFSKLLSVKASSGDEIASIDASGSAKFANVATNNLEITSDEGRVLGNENIRDAAEIPPGETTINVQKAWQTQPASIVVSPTYNTQAWVTNISATGFTINVNTPPEDTQTIFWWAIW